MLRKNSCFIFSLFLIAWINLPAATIVTNQEPAFDVSPTIEELANTCYPWLESSLFFNAQFIKKIKDVRRWQVKYLDAQIFNVTTEDGITLEGTYFDRGSDRLLVVGPGFTNERELMSPFVSVFDNYDLVLFDFRGHGFSEFHYLWPSSWPRSSSKFFFGADARKATFGRKEPLDVLAIISHLKKQKPYTAVYGVGVCYASFIFLKTALAYPGLFDKLILDGCWLSLALIVDKLKKDPLLICVPQKGGWKDNWLWKHKWAQDTLVFLARYLMGFDLEEVSLLPLFKEKPQALAATEILFWQGNHDLLTPKEEFDVLWQALTCKNKTVVLTENPHVRNHWKQKELYKLISELFLDLPHDQFLAYLQNPSLVHDRLLAQITEQLEKAQNNNTNHPRQPLGA